jgi:hypothetical protein
MPHRALELALLYEQSRKCRMRLERPNADEFWIGVERRQSLGSIATDWNSSRREQYLLEVDVEQPLSVDKRVWPIESGDGGCRVGFSVVERITPERVRSIWYQHEVEGEFRLLGYDIADDVFLSGLSNCSYSDDEKALLRPTWSRRLNQFHLFDHADDASQFHRITETRVPEHAPFFVFGVYLLSP